jgi:hypothetical protein
MLLPLQLAAAWPPMYPPLSQACPTPPLPLSRRHLRRRVPAGGCPGCPPAGPDAARPPRRPQHAAPDPQQRCVLGGATTERAAVIGAGGSNHACAQSRCRRCRRPRPVHRQLRRGVPQPPRGTGGHARQRERAAAGALDQLHPAHPVLQGRPAVLGTAAVPPPAGRGGHRHPGVQRRRGRNRAGWVGGWGAAARYLAPAAHGTSPDAHIRRSFGCPVMCGGCMVRRRC